MNDLAEEAKKEAAREFALKYEAVSHESRKKRNIQIFFQGLVLVALVVAAILFFVIGITHTSGKSMYPTYNDNQLIFFLKHVKSFERGDVVALDMTSGEDYIKRIVALPGDTVMVKDGKFILNGEVQDEAYVEKENRTEPEDGNVTYPFTLKDGEYFVMGDNREGSLDSRAFGPVVRGQIKGRVLN